MKGSVLSKRATRLQKRNEEIIGIPSATTALPKKKVPRINKNDSMEMDEDEYSAFNTSSQQTENETA